MPTETVNDDVKSKIKDTFQNKYGVSHPMEIDGVKDKIKNTCLEKYGVEHPMQTDLVKNKIRETFKEKGIAKFHEGKYTYEWAKKLGVAHSTMKVWIRKYGFEQAVKMDKRQTAIESCIANFLDEINVKYEQRKIDNLFPDFIIDNHMLIIETDGLYWHSDAINNDKQYHKFRQKKFAEHGYDTLFFREDEINNKFEIVKSIILNKLNMTENRVGARKCKVKEVDSVTRRKFLEDNHLMGKGRGKAFGLYYKDELVCIMQYVNIKDYVEISRFCPKRNWQIVGGLSRLLSKIDSDKIITFIDRRYGSGKYLTNLGFAKESEHLSFRWVKNDQSVHRRQFLGNSGYDQGWFKMWDCGQAKYVLYRLSESITM